MDQMTLIGAQNKVIKTRRQQQQRRQQFSSIILFVGAIILVNLCPFQQDFQPDQQQQQRFDIEQKSSAPIDRAKMSNMNYYLNNIGASLKFVKLMFSNPIKLGKRTMRYTQAEARVLGKMAKVWYIKKKIKKLSKKLKKHTIAVPVFTAIPIYEHSYYPQPHVTHVSHGAMHHHAAAASSYVPTVTQLTTAASNQLGSAAAQSHQQLATSASNNHQVAASYRMSPPNGVHPAPMYHAHHPAASHQIINAYQPSPPLYVDEAGGLYGHYGNAYGRYDGGYQYW